MKQDHNIIGIWKTKGRTLAISENGVYSCIDTHWWHGEKKTSGRWVLSGDHLQFTATNRELGESVSADIRVTLIETIKSSTNSSFTTVDTNGVTRIYKL